MSNSLNNTTYQAFLECNKAAAICSQEFEKLGTRKEVYKSVLSYHQSNELLESLKEHLNAVYRIRNYLIQHQSLLNDIKKLASLIDDTYPLKAAKFPWPDTVDPTEIAAFTTIHLHIDMIQSICMHTVTDEYVNDDGEWCVRYNIESVTLQLDEEAIGARYPITLDEDGQVYPFIVDKLQTILKDHFNCHNTPLDQLHDEVISQELFYASLHPDTPVSIASIDAG